MVHFALYLAEHCSQSRRMQAYHIMLYAFAAGHVDHVMT